MWTLKKKKKNSKETNRNENIIVYVYLFVSIVFPRFIIAHRPPFFFWAIRVIRFVKALCKYQRNEMFNKIRKVVNCSSILSNKACTVCTYYLLSFNPQCITYTYRLQHEWPNERNGHQTNYSFLRIIVRWHWIRWVTPHPPTHPPILLLPPTK